MGLRLAAKLGFGLMLYGMLAGPGASGQTRRPVPPVSGRRMKRLPEMEAQVLTGRFVAQTAGTRVSAFSPNAETYIFEADLRGYTQVVKVRHEFLHQEARVPMGVLDYNTPRSFIAIRDSSCDEAWGSLSTRRVFDSDGMVAGTGSDLVYAQGAPELRNEADEVLPCYVVGRISPKWSERLAKSSNFSR